MDHPHSHLGYRPHLAFVVSFYGWILKACRVAKVILTLLLNQIGYLIWDVCYNGDMDLDSRNLKNYFSYDFAGRSQLPRSASPCKSGQTHWILHWRWSEVARVWIYAKRQFGKSPFQKWVTKFECKHDQRCIKSFFQVSLHRFQVLSHKSNRNFANCTGLIGNLYLWLPFHNLFASVCNMGCRHIKLTEALAFGRTKTTMVVVSVFASMA